MGPTCPMRPRGAFWSLSPSLLGPCGKSMAALLKRGLPLLKERGYHFKLKKEGVTTWEIKCLAAPSPLIWGGGEGWASKVGALASLTSLHSVLAKAWRSPAEIIHHIHHRAVVLVEFSSTSPPLVAGSRRRRRPRAVRVDTSEALLVVALDQDRIAEEFVHYDLEIGFRSTTTSSTFIETLTAVRSTRVCRLFLSLVTCIS